jgi:hypothetical protein
LVTGTIGRYTWKRIEFMLAHFTVALLLLFAVTDTEKQGSILDMAEEACGDLPAELVVAIMRQEGGKGAFYCDGWRYNSFYLAENAPWAQPENGDGVMQVTEASGWHETSGPYEHSEVGYRNSIEDGCGYLNELYGRYQCVTLTALHYNSGPNTLYIYMNGMGDRDYLSKVGNHMQTFVPSLYGIENETLVEKLYEAQNVLDGYLETLPERMSLDYYKPYQEALDEEIKNL